MALATLLLVSCGGTENSAEITPTAISTSTPFPTRTPFPSETPFPTREAGYEFVPADNSLRLYKYVENETGNLTLVVGVLDDGEWVIATGSGGWIHETEEYMGFSDNRCFVVVIWGPTSSTYTIETFYEDVFFYVPASNDFSELSKEYDVEEAATDQIEFVIELQACSEGVDVWRINE